MSWLAGMKSEIQVIIIWSMRARRWGESKGEKANIVIQPIRSCP